MEASSYPAKDTDILNSVKRSAKEERRYPFDQNGMKDLLWGVRQEIEGMLIVVFTSCGVGSEIIC